jgi:hypothetical protein
MPVKDCVVRRKGFCFFSIGLQDGDHKWQKFSTPHAANETITPILT